MGWTSYHAKHYTRRGEIDRKSECDEVFTENGENGKWEVLKSSMHGSTYYAAVRRTRPSGESYVFAAVCLTSVDSSDYFDFSYKDMDESMGPYSYDCPLSILDLLSPTENEYALAWRERCRSKAKSRNSLSNLPIGTTIEFEFAGKTMRATKTAPSYQFKTPWWKTGPSNYISKSRIPSEYRIIA